MIRFIKKIAAGLIAFSILFCVAALSGCSEDYLPEYESGCFRYAVRTEKDGTEKAYLIGLTELGEQQKVLVYPEYIDDIKVYGIGYDHHTAVGAIPVGNFGNSVLEKFFFPKNPEEKVIGNLGVMFPNAYAIYWDNNNAKHEFLFSGLGVIYGYNYYIANYNVSLPDLCYIANVSYMYNYDGAVNDGYYWVDSYDEDIITFIPLDPEREGYLFDGWYKEPECINQWNFETDRTGKVLSNETCEDFETYEGIYLYAKWVRNTRFTA